MPLFIDFFCNLFFVSETSSPSPDMRHIHNMITIPSVGLSQYVMSSSLSMISVLVLCNRIETSLAVALSIIWGQNPSGVHRGSTMWVTKTRCALALIRARWHI